MNIVIVSVLLMLFRCAGSIKIGRVISQRSKVYPLARHFVMTLTNGNAATKLIPPTALYAATSEIKNAVAPTIENIFEIDLPTNENNVDLLKIRHSTAHVMAMAVQKVHPDARVTIGPWIDNG